MAAAKILTQTIKGNVTGESEKMEALEIVAEDKVAETKKNIIMNMQLDCQDASMHYLQGWPK